MTTDSTQQVVFIDSTVPDIQDLIDGVQPGVQVFVIDPGSDGVQQIADILAANDFHDLSSISIVSHGADGEVMLGSTTLSEANLASYSRALAEIGTAIAPGGDIQLYGCDVALGSTGQQFINDFSTLAGGVTVEAATHLVGSADLGANWTLDASSNNPAPTVGSNGSGSDPADNTTPTVTPSVTSPLGTPSVPSPLGSSSVTSPLTSSNVASPFTSQALANFQGDLAAQGTGVVFDLSSGNQVDQRIEDDVNNSTTESDIFQETGGGVFNVGTPGPAIVIDTVANLYFVLNGNQNSGQLLEGTLNSTADPTQVAAWNSFYTSATSLSKEVSLGQSEIDPGALAIDLANHRIFIGTGSNFANQNGFVALTYSQTTGAVSNISYIATMSTGGAQPSSPEEMVYNNNTIYFIDNAVGTIDENGVYRIDLGSGSFTQMVTQTQFPDFSAGSFSNGGLTGIALDPVDGRVFFSTRDANSIGSTQDAIWEVSTGASNATATKLALPAGVTILEADALTYDSVKNVLYWANHDDVDPTPTNNIVMAQLNAAGTSVVSVTTIDPGLPSGNNDEPQISSLQFDQLPTLSGLVGTAAMPTEEHGAVTLASGITITDPDNASVASATVFFGSGSFAGASDTLGATTGGTNISASYNSSTETLTLTGIDSFAHYAQVLDTVTFTAGENPTDFGSQPTRVIDWIVSDGAPDVPFGDVNSASSTITVVFVNDPPTLTNVANGAQYTEEQVGGTTLSGAVSVSDPDDLNLKSATVSITGGSFAGDTDTLAVSGASGGTFDAGKIAVSYNSTSQTLTLSGTDTLAEYQAALREVTFSSGENPTNFGSNATRTITWVAMDPSGTAIGGQDTTTLSNTTTVTITNVNDPPTLALGTTTAQWTEEQSPAATTLSPTVTVTDADSLDLASATVQITGGFFAGDTLSATGNGTIGVTYNSSTGTLTLTGSDTLADYQTVLDSVTYNGGENPTDFASDQSRTLTWTLNDGGGTANSGVQIGTATSTVSVTFVNDPPTLASVATTAQYTEEQVGGTTLSSGLSVSDPDDLDLASATIKVIGGSFSGATDVLRANGATNATVVNGSNTISIFYNSTTETLTLTGNDTLADYQFLLDRVTFTAGENPTNFGSNTTRSISWQVQDPSGTLNGGSNVNSPINTTTVTITNVNDPPTLALGTTTAQWTEEQSPAATTLSPTVTVTDADNLDLVSATVSITGGSFTGDTLLVSGQTSGVTIAGTNITPTFTGNGIVTFSGSDTLADYQSALELVTFNGGENPTDFASDKTRTLTWTLNDGGGTANSGAQIGTATSTVSVTFVNDAPILSNVAPSVFAAPTSTVTLSPSVTVTDVDDLTLKSATVAITGGTFGGDGDVLTAEGTTNGTFVQNTHTITIAYNSTTETLSLTGTDTLADYQNVLDTVAWHSTAGDPTNAGSNPTRTLSWTVQDPSGTLNSGSDTSTPQTETLTIDQPATLTGLTQTAQWTEEQASPTTLSPNVTISDPDGVNAQLSATVSIVGGTFTNDHDTLSATATGNITVNYNSSTETLTLTGSDSLANYQTVLDSVTFNAGENPTNYHSDPTRTLTWTVADHVGAESTPVTTTIDITQVNDPPTLSGLSTASWIEEGADATVSPNASVSDPDSLTLVSATVVLSSTDIVGHTFTGSGQATGDVLTATPVGNVTVSYNSTTETLSLTGSDTLADYTQVLDSITFHGDENPTNFGSDPTRTVTWTLNDGNSSFATGTFTSTISITNINDPPALSNVATSVNFTEEGGAVTLSGAVSASDPDNLTLTGATVKITGGTFAGDGDVLSATGTSSIVVSYNSSTETLTLSGTDTLAHYASVLDTVTFNGGENPNNFGSNPTRTVTWTLDDGSASSNLSTAVTSTVSITNVNDPPTLGNVTPTAFFTEEGSAVTLSSNVSVTDPDDLDLASATVAITGGTFSGDGDTLAISGVTSGTLDGGKINYSYNSTTEALTLTGADTLLAYQNALDAITYNAGQNPNDFGSNPTRTVVWTLNDGGGTANSGVQVSTPVTSTISITNVNDAPTLTNVAPSANFTEEGAAVTLSSAVAVTDPDDVNLSSATVKITGGTFANDQDVLAATTTGTSITASYNSSTETLTLSGLDTLAHYQSVLDTVTFNAGENPNDYGSNPTRTLTWTLMDPSGTANSGVNVSAPVTSTVSITNVNDPPTLSNVASLANVGFTFQTITISPSASASDPDNLKLASATVQITGGTFSGDGDVLAATTTGTSITASYNSSTETLTLTGSDTLADYSQVLDSVTFDSTNPNATNSGADRTRTVTWTLNDGSGSNNLSAPATTTIRFQNGVHYDFNGDSISDLAFQQEAFNAGGTKGTPQIWLWNGSSVTSMTTLPNPGGTWHIVASADVNGDGKADLIWQNDNGQPGIWLMNGPTPIAEAGLANPGANWHLIASGDFNGDGKSDLLWQESDGTLGVWLMNGTTPIAEAGIGNPGPTWTPVGTADFNNDGHDDILLQNKTTGNLMVDLMNGTTVTSSVTINVGDPSWHAVSTGTFNGVPEIAWQNDNGTPAIWLFNGTTPIAEAALPNPGTSWSLISVDHFTPDGNADLLWQNINGGMGMWELNGTSIVSEFSLPNPGAGVESMNGNLAVDPPGRTSASNSTTNATNANTTSGPDNGTLRQSMPDTANAASALNTSVPVKGTGLSIAGAAPIGSTGSQGFAAVTGAALLSPNQLATSDPNSTQHLLFTGG